MTQCNMKICHFCYLIQRSCYSGLFCVPSLVMLTICQLTYSACICLLYPAQVFHACVIVSEPSELYSHLLIKRRKVLNVRLLKLPDIPALGHTTQILVSCQMVLSDIFSLLILRSDAEGQIIVGTQCLRSFVVPRFSFLFALQCLFKI